jgi:hypothetical protein
MMSGGAASWFVQRLRARRHLAGSRVGHHRRPVIPCSSRMTSKREGYRPESTGADFPGQRSISASAAGHGLAGTGSVGARKRHRRRSSTLWHHGRRRRCMTPVGEPWCRWHIPHVYAYLVKGVLVGRGLGPDHRLPRLRRRRRDPWRVLLPRTTTAVPKRPDARAPPSSPRCRSGWWCSRCSRRRTVAGRCCRCWTVPRIRPGRTRLARGRTGPARYRTRCW